MSYQIDDYSKTKIFITDGWREWFLPKFRIDMEVSEPYLTINWDDSELGSPKRRQLTVDYTDVSGYGYANPTSAADLKSIIEAYEISAWTEIGPGGDLLNAKGQLLSHDGIGDAILNGGTNEYILQRDDSTLTGLKWVPITTPLAAVSSALIVPTIIGAQTTLTDGATYYWGSNGAVQATTVQGSAKIYNLTGKTLTIVAISTMIRWTVGTSEAASVYLRYNNTTDHLISNAVAGNVAIADFAVTGLSIAWASGDYVEMKMVNPTWVTNPSSMSAGGQIHCLSPIN